MPKGVLWRQEDIFFGALGGTSDWAAQKFASVEAVVEVAAQRRLCAPARRRRSCTAPRTGWRSLRCTRAARSSSSTIPNASIPTTSGRPIAREKVRFLTIVGDAFGRPLHRSARQASSTTCRSFGILLSGGAILTPALKDAFLERIPHLMIIDGFGASETGGQGPQVTLAAARRRPARFRMNDDTLVLKHDLSGALDAGQRRDRLAGAHAATCRSATSRTPRRRAQDVPGRSTARATPCPATTPRVDADGTITVLGRGSVSINSGGEKIYPEEVEKALKHHPSVYDAVVVGTPNERFGEQVTAVVQARAGETPTADELIEFAAQHLARYKLPRADRLRRRDGAQPVRQGRLSLGEAARPREARDQLQQ